MINYSRYSLQWMWRVLKRVQINGSEQQQRSWRQNVTLQSDVMQTQTDSWLAKIKSLREKSGDDWEAPARQRYAPSCQIGPNGTVWSFTLRCTCFMSRLGLKMSKFSHKCLLWFWNKNQLWAGGILQLRKVINQITRDPCFPGGQGKTRASVLWETKPGASSNNRAGPEEQGQDCRRLQVQPSMKLTWGGAAVWCVFCSADPHCQTKTQRAAL